MGGSTERDASQPPTRTASEFRIRHRPVIEYTYRPGAEAINHWGPEDAELYLEGLFETRAARSRHQWTLDISVLSTRYGIYAGDRRDGEPV